MKHLTEDELVGRYYGEDQPDAARHVEACSDCASALASLKADLADLRSPYAPARDDSYGDQVWSAIAPMLPAYTPKRSWQSRGLWLSLVGATACAAMVASAFYAGRMWEHRQNHVTVSHAPSPARERVVVVLLSDHLDRSERLLVELKHANPDDKQIISPLRDEAKSLLQSNRKCRQEAVKNGDPALTNALDHLDQVLTQLAEEPGGLDAAAITRLQDQMKADGLLFEVRVLRSRIPRNEALTKPHLKGGTA